MGIGVYFVITTTIAILIAITLASIISPGSILDLTALQETHDLFDADLKLTEGFSLDAIPDTISNVIPRNPIVSYLEGQMFSILIMAVIVGLSMAALPRDSVKPLLDLLESIQKVTLYILLMTMKIVPFAVFGLIVGMVAKVGVETMAGLGVYMVTVILGLRAMLLVYTMIIKIVAKRPISSTFSKFRNPQSFAFSTASSMATMPMILKTDEEDLKLDKHVSKFVIPLGTTVNMDGIALYQIIAVFFLAQLFAIELCFIHTCNHCNFSFSFYWNYCRTRAGTIVLSTILITVGIPPVGILLLLSVDRILDMIRTMVNVTGALTASCAFDRITRDKE